MIFLTGILISAFIGCLIGHFKDRRGDGLIMGALLGPLGWILMLFDVRLLTALALSAVIVGGSGFVLWKVSEEHAAKYAELRAENNRRQRDWEAEQAARSRVAPAVVTATPAPQWDLYGKPINRESAEDGAAPAPTPRPAPNAREIAQQIAEKYRAR